MQIDAISDAVWCKKKHIHKKVFFSVRLSALLSFCAFQIIRLLRHDTTLIKPLCIENFEQTF